MYTKWIKGKRTREGTLFSHIETRCNSTKYHKIQPSYIGCYQSEKFKDFQLFSEWCNRQIGFEGTDKTGKFWQIDKDLLVKGNKEYSENFCIFIPACINSFLTKREAERGRYLIGVSKPAKRRFVANCNDPLGRYPMYLGYFDTELEAHVKYKQTKEGYAKDLAETYKEFIDPRAYVALRNYVVEITD